MGKIGAIGAGVLAVALAGCTLGRMVDQFSDPEPQTVRLSCGEAYKVYEKQQPRRLVVASSLGQEYGREDPCPGFEKLQKAERFHKIAQDYLASTGRGECTVAGIAPLSITEYAARYRCRKPGEKPAAEEGPARRKRGKPGRLGA